MAIMKGKELFDGIVVLGGGGLEITPMDWAAYVGEGKYFITTIPVESTDKIHCEFKYLGGNANTCILGHDGDYSSGTFELSTSSGNYFKYADQTVIHQPLDNNEHLFEIDGNTHLITFDNNTWGSFSISQYKNYAIGFRQYRSNPNVAIKKLWIKDGNGDYKMNAYAAKIGNYIFGLYDEVNDCFYPSTSVYDDE